MTRDATLHTLMDSKYLAPVDKRMSISVVDNIFAFNCNYSKALLIAATYPFPGCSKL